MTGERIIAMRDALASLRTPLEGHWDELSAHFMPFRLSSSDLPDIPSAKILFDSTGRHAAAILANGLASLIIPREEVWFEFSAPPALRQDDEAVRFFRNASAIAREYFEASNFYEEAQESLIESAVYGTSALYIGDLDENRDTIHFRHLPVKTYLIAEDATGRVNRLFRDLHLTPLQAADEFGIDRLPAKVRDKLDTAEAATTKFHFVQAVYPRTERPSDDAPERDRTPYVSATVFADTKEIVTSSGFHEFAFACHRYRRFGRTPYGFGPGTYALGDARQLEQLNELADLATEKSVFPPVVAPSSLEGEIGIGSAEITFVDPTDPNSAAILREWATSARYDIALDRLREKRDQLERAFHVDLFQLFSSRAREKQPMTATEASLVAGEKLTQFSPTFGRLVSEFLDPILTRTFGILFRAGLLGMPPSSVIGPDGKSIASPTVTYKNAIMLAMQERNNMAFSNFLALISPAAQVDPTVFDAIDMAAASRLIARNAGLPEEIIRPSKDVAAMQASRAQAQQAQQAAMIAEQAASAAGKLGSAPPAIQQALTA